MALIYLQSLPIVIVMMVKEKDVNLCNVDDLYDNDDDVDDFYDNDDDVDDFYDNDDDVDDFYDNDDDNEDHHDNDDVEKKKRGGVGEGSFFLTDLSISNRKQLKLDQRTAHICRFLVKVTRISVSRCTRLK